MPMLCSPWWPSCLLQVNLTNIDLAGNTAGVHSGAHERAARAQLLLLLLLLLLIALYMHCIPE